MFARTFYKCLSLSLYLLLLSLPRGAGALVDPDNIAGQTVPKQRKQNISAGRPLPQTSVAGLAPEIKVSDEMFSTADPSSSRTLKIPLAGRADDKKGLAALVEATISNNPEITSNLQFGTDLVLTYQASFGPITWLQYRQRLPQEGMDVAGSYLDLAVRSDSKQSDVVLARSRLYQPNHLALADDAGFTATNETFRGKARTALGVAASLSVPGSEKRSIRFAAGKWRRVYEAAFTESHYTALIDLDSGEVLGRQDRRLYHDYSGAVSGRLVLFDPLSTGANLDELPLANLQLMTSAGTSTFTSAQGDFGLSSSEASLQGVANLDGRWASVISLSGANLSESEALVPGVPAQLMFNAVGAEELATAQVNAYYHVNFIHDWLHSRLGGALPGIDRALPTRVNLSRACNAYYSSGNPQLTFFSAGQAGSSSCINTAFDTVIYHEYGHFVDDMAGGIEISTSGLGLSEGWGDILASYGSGQPLNGEGFFGAGSRVRTADNTYQYPEDGRDESHQLGQAWAGFAWHLRERLIDSYGQAAGAILAEQLVLPTLLANSRSIPDALVDLLLLDDNDADLSNGTPHWAAIAAAAAEHAIPIHQPGFAEIAAPVGSALLGTPVLDIIGTVGGNHLRYYELFYGEGDRPEVWYPITGRVPQAVNSGLLGSWQTGALPMNLYTIRLVVTMESGIVFEASTRLGLEPPVTRLSDRSLYVSAIESGNVITSQLPLPAPYFGSGIWLYDLRTGVGTIFGEDRQNRSSPGWDNGILSYVQMPVDVGTGATQLIRHDWNTGASRVLFERAPLSEPWGEGRIWAYSTIRTFAVHGRIAFVEDRMIDFSPPTATRQIDLYNSLTDSIQSVLPQSEQNISLHPQLATSGDFLAWITSVSGRFHVMLHDLRSGETRMVGPEYRNQVAPAFDGDRLVYTTFYREISILDLNTGLTTQVPGTRNCYDPDLQGDYLAYVCGLQGNEDVFVQSLSSGIVKRITSDTGDQYRPHLTDDSVVWMDTRHASDGITINAYAARLDGGPLALPQPVRLAITPLPGSTAVPEISANSTPTPTPAVTDKGGSLPGLLRSFVRSKSLKLRVEVNKRRGRRPLKVKFRARRKGGLKGIKVLWDFNNDGIIDAKGKRASFIFVKNGRIKVRAVLVKGALRSAVAKMTIRVYK